MTHFATLIFLLSSGFFGALVVFSSDQPGNRFFRLIAVMSLIGWIFTLMLIDPSLPGSTVSFGFILGLIGGGAMYVGSLSTNNTGIRSGSFWITWLMLIGMFVVIALWPPHLNIIEYRSPAPLIFIHLVISAGILGASMDAMICGHWYLINHNMDLGPIRRISFTLAGLLLVKGSMLLGQLGWYFFEQPGVFEQILFGYPLFFWVRTGVGLGGGLLFTWMAWVAIKHNNPQAATGILYGCILWIIVGESSGFYLMTSTGVAL